MPETLFCDDLFKYSRWITRAVTVGDMVIGGYHPISVQSMTTTDTMNTQATVEQSIRMIEAGCELVRITAPSRKEAENLKVIKEGIRRSGFTVPIVADIHFTPVAAEIAARIVEKVRINPGNYADRKKFEQKEYTDSEYASELDRIRERFIPLIRICKEYGTAMRIGTNHGSLSDRIMNRYGDTPLGMVESAMEFIRICESESYFNVVLSMKASNPQVMVSAYRLLVATMKDAEMAYPLHLGVTEAGEGEDGRIKSAVGIGTLLEDGLGDTIRVSLTEEPEKEIPFAKTLVERYAQRSKHEPIEPVRGVNHDWFHYLKRKTIQVGRIGGNQVPVVIQGIPENAFDNIEFQFKGYAGTRKREFTRIDDIASDLFYAGEGRTPDKSLKGLSLVVDSNLWGGQVNTFPLFNSIPGVTRSSISDQMNFLVLKSTEINQNTLVTIKQLKKFVLILESENEHWAADIRKGMLELIAAGVKAPVIFKRFYPLQSDAFTAYPSTDMGSLFLNGFGDGIWLQRENDNNSLSVSFGILQATRTRISKTEFISCPSCGRTLFNLQETTEKIRTRTGHLKGVKIAIMGCIVNGPGEMADADYGYVGTGEGVISLYKGKEVVKRNIPAPDAVDALVELITAHGDWIEPRE